MEREVYVRALVLTNFVELLLWDVINATAPQTLIFLLRCVVVVIAVEVFVL